MRERAAIVLTLLLAALAVVAVASGAATWLQSRLIGVEQMAPVRLARLLDEGAAPLVIDVRRPSEYATAHISGAALVALPDLDGYLTRTANEHPGPLVTVCRRGRTSQLAAMVATAHGVHEVYNLTGGMKAWRDAGLPVLAGEAERLDPELLRPPRLATTLLQQVLVTVTGLGLKPLYMLLSLLIVVGLWRSEQRGLVLVRRAVASFLAGETACAANFLVAGGASDLLELLHGAGMVVMGALLPWGLMVLADERVVCFWNVERRCILQRFCGACWKHQPVRCGLARLFLFIAPALAVLALMPLCAQLKPVNVIMPVLASDVLYVRSPLVVLTEFRTYPLVGACLLLFAAWQARGRLGQLRTAQAPFFWGIGLVSYALVRFTLQYAFADAIAWADVWEEITELVAVVGVCLLLAVFRTQLGLRAAPAPPQPAGREP